MSLKSPDTKAAAKRIGEKVRAFRNSRGLTQKELAGDNVSRNMLSMIESGNALPSLETLMHISNMLEVPTGMFFAEGYEAKQYEKKEAVTTVRSLMDEGKFADAAEMCEPFADDDGEMRLYLSVCRMRCGLEFLDKFMLASADIWFTAAESAAKGIPFFEEHFSSVCNFIRLLSDSVNSESVPDSLITSEGSAVNGVPASISAYLSAYKAVKDGDAACAAAIARSGLLGKFHSLHIRGAVLMADGDYDGATRLFDLALSSDGGGFYSRYKLICDLELCRRDAGDFEAAYALSTSRMEMLGIFSK